MALRFRSNVAVEIAGSTIAHGLGVAPDEISALQSNTGAPGNIYIFSAATSTSIFLAAVANAASAQVIAAVTHSLIA